MEGNEKDRLYKLSQQSITAPISGLIAQCYGVLKANWQEPNKLELPEFTDLFHRVCIGADGITMLVWDNVTEKYYSTHIPLINIASIREHPQKEQVQIVIGGPIYDINFQLKFHLEEQGTAEDLFARTEEIRQLIESGWSNVDRRYAVPVLHISPYDLCAIANLYEISYRLSWFVMFMLDYKSPYNLVRSFGVTLCNKYDIPALGLFFNQSLQLFATLIIQSGDVELFKRYIVRGYADFHQQIPNEQIKAFTKDMYNSHGMEVPDLDSLALLDMSQHVEVRFLVLTSVYMNAV